MSMCRTPPHVLLLFQVLFGKTALLHACFDVAGWQHATLEFDCQTEESLRRHSYPSALMQWGHYVVWRKYESLQTSTHPSLAGPFPEAESLVPFPAAAEQLCRRRSDLKEDTLPSISFADSLKFMVDYYTVDQWILDLSHPKGIPGCPRALDHRSKPGCLKYLSCPVHDFEPPSLHTMKSYEVRNLWRLLRRSLKRNARSSRTCYSPLGLQHLLQLEALERDLPPLVVVQTRERRRIRRGGRRRRRCLGRLVVADQSLTAVRGQERRRGHHGGGRD